MRINPSTLLPVLTIAATLGGCVTHTNRNLSYVSVERFYDEFNRGDYEEILWRTSRTTEWLEVSGDQITLKARGTDEIRALLEGYFASGIADGGQADVTLVKRNHLSVTRRASGWRGKPSDWGANAMVTFEMDSGRFVRIWYFPPAPDESARP